MAKPCHNSLPQQTPSKKPNPPHPPELSQQNIEGSFTKDRYRQQGVKINRYYIVVMASESEQNKIMVAVVKKTRTVYVLVRALNLGLKV